MYIYICIYKYTYIYIHNSQRYLKSALKTVNAVYSLRDPKKIAGEYFVGNPSRNWMITRGSPARRNPHECSSGMAWGRFSTSTSPNSVVLPRGN